MARFPEKKSVIDSVIRRAHYLANQMIFSANTRADKEKGDPKVGGHSSASSSAIHILGTLHLLVKSGFDHIANKPHASPADHSFNYLMDLFLQEDLSRLTLDEANLAMSQLRAYPKAGERVFQSYHSIFDPDHHNFFPSGTVGIPPVQAGYLAHAYRYAKEHGYEVPDAHFWSLIGDSEFREGSLFEAVPDFAEREIGNLTWIIDYNRQSLDGHRLTNPKALGGSDAMRIQKTMEANGWDVIQLMHGPLRKRIFKAEGGEAFQKFLEQDLADYELQALLNLRDPKSLCSYLKENHPQLKTFLKSSTEIQIFEALRDFAGHDVESVYDALVESKNNPRKPCMIIAHTIKGWGLQMAASSGNHSALPEEEEIKLLRKNAGVADELLFARFDSKSEEGLFLKKRGEELFKQIEAQHKLKEKNKSKILSSLSENGEMGGSLDINLKMASYPHTQWMLGQLTAKLTRIANTPWKVTGDSKSKNLTDAEKAWKLAAEHMVSMAPDVGTSTNLNPAMDGKIFGSIVDDFEAELSVKDTKTPDLVPGEETSDRFLRFEIAEANVMSCMGSYGRMRDLLGIPLLPLMTVYDFFVKRALDQFFYNLYWRSSFVLVGTPSGVTLSPEGAQHGWKSDFQIPNQITWEPFFCQELDWILSDALKRHMTFTNEGRTGVFIRGVTRGIEQKLFLQNLKTQLRFKTHQALLVPKILAESSPLPEGAANEETIEAISEAEIFEIIRSEVLAGAYRLLDYSGYAGYEPGDNVVHVFAMGSLVTEALKASEELLKKGIYANVIVVTSPDLLVGNLGRENQYGHLRQYLGINGNLVLSPVLGNGTSANGSHSLASAELLTLSGRRIPIVSVHDGEPGLLDNIGSIVGVRHESLAVRKHSKCGRPVDIYHYHGIDSEAVVEASLQVLAETAMEQVTVRKENLGDLSISGQSPQHWRELI